MNRRSFIKTLSILGTVACLPMTACSLKGDAQDVLDALTAIYNWNPTASWAPDLKIAIGDMQVAIADWNGSSVNCELQSALTIAGAILDSIPLGATIDLIVTIALAGLTTLLGELMSCTTPAAHKLSREYWGHFHSDTPTYLHYQSEFKDAAKWRVAGDFKKAFNDGAKASGLPNAAIQ